jgi:hypothetical protein
MVAVGVLCTDPRSGVRGPTILTISRERRGQSTSTTENQCAPFLGCIVVLCRLAAFPLALLLKQFGNGTQRIIHLLSRFELSCHIRFKHDELSCGRVKRKRARSERIPKIGRRLQRLLERRRNAMIALCSTRE